MHRYLNVGFKKGFRKLWTDPIVAESLPGFWLHVVFGV
jgi:hypothetical protein